jgi:predicted AAA+ superfamily ATPase
MFTKNHIYRSIEPIIRDRLYRGKAIVVVGPRQVGKTTLLKHIAADLDPNHLWLDCDEPDIRNMLTDASSDRLKNMVGRTRMVIIDEAQRVRDIGITLKLMVDQIPDTQLMVSGSSALDLSNQINEPLTGRKFEFELLPFSYMELSDHFGSLKEGRLLEQRLVFGTYPDVVNQPGDEIRLLNELSQSYLYKDIFRFQEIRKPDLLPRLLEALALQLGFEVGMNELAQTIGADSETVRRYLDLLEKTYVVFSLRSWSRNVRNELKKSRKVYFFDNGIRNAIIRNFQALELRTDQGALWENYLVSERRKANMANERYASSWFWRTTQQQEIDYLEDQDGLLQAYEFKWNPKANVRWPKTFKDHYPDHTLDVVNRENYGEFLRRKR